MDQSVALRFWSKVDIVDSTCCWLWKAGLSDEGYGTFYYKKTCGAHRFALWLYSGVEPELACHSCNNRQCVNPFHLYDGTHQSNLSDAVLAGKRQLKLTPEKVRELRNLHAAGATCAELAEKFEVGRMTAWKIAKRKVWKHVE